MHKNACCLVCQSSCDFWFVLEHKIRFPYTGAKYVGESHNGFIGKKNSCHPILCTHGQWSCLGMLSLDMSFLFCTSTSRISIVRESISDTTCAVTSESSNLKDKYTVVLSVIVPSTKPSM